MTAISYIRLFVVIACVLMIFLSFLYYAKMHLVFRLSAFWVVFSLFCMGIAIEPTLWRFVTIANESVYIMFSIVFIIIFFVLFYVSVSVCRNLMKIQELSINQALQINETKEMMAYLSQVAKDVQEVASAKVDDGEGI